MTPIVNVSDRERELASVNVVLQKEKALLLAERDALKVDAERYQWLVQQHFPKDPPIAQVVWKRNNNPHGAWVNLVDGSELSNQIDEAMKEGAK